LENFFVSFREWMRGFYDLLRENLSSLFMLWWWISISIISLMSQFLHLDFLARKLAPAYKITGCDNPEDQNLNRHRHGNLQTCINMKSACHISLVQVNYLFTFAI
jgi:hypothetical protein